MRTKIVAVHKDRIMPLPGTLHLHAVGETVQDWLNRIGKHITDPNKMPALVVLPCKDEDCPWRDTGGEG